MWSLVARYVEEQIRSGRLTPGAFLPSVRALATDLGINRNTVSRAYQELKREGLVHAYHGRGMAVARAARKAPSVRNGISEVVTSVVTEAALAGLSREQLLESIQETVLMVYRDALVPVAFVECTEREAILLSEELRKRVHMTIQPIVLGELGRLTSSDGPFKIVVTTYRHLEEVTSALSGTDIEVVGVHHFVASESMLELARLAPRLRATVIAPNSSSLTWMKNVVETYGRATVTSVVLTDDESLRSALADAQVAIGTSLTVDAIQTVRPGMRSITVEFHLDEQSLLHLCDRIGVHARRAVSPSAFAS